MADGNICHPPTVLDDHSRYSLCIDAKENERSEGVTTSFLRLFEEYGLPNALLCDNGNLWGTSQNTGYTYFEIWLMDYGILPIHGRIRHPQTQGKEERFHRTLKTDLLKHTTIADLNDAQRQFDAVRYCYNYEWPHEAIGMTVPAERYHPLRSKVPAYLPQWEYPAGYELRRVKETGFVTYRETRIFSE